MFKIFSSSFQSKLISYGIIPTICLSSFYLHADEPKKQDSLVILEGRQQGKTPEGANLQQKVQTLSSLAKEQSARIQGLHDEVKTLKDKLHLSQISNETGSPRQLYAALKQESAKNKETQDKLNQIIQQLTADNAAEQQRNKEAEQHITSLMTALSTQSDNIEKIENDHKEELDRMVSKTEENSRYKTMYAMLEEESDQYKKTLNELNDLIQKQKDENAQEKDKLVHADQHIDNLLAALNDQSSTIDSIHQDYKSQIEQLARSVTEGENYKTLHDALEQDFSKNKDAKNELEQLIVQLKQENEIEKSRILEAEANVGSLLSHLSEQKISFDELHNKHEENLSQISHHENNAALQAELKQALEQELSLSKTAHIELQDLIQEFRKENHADKLKISDAEEHIQSLKSSIDSLNQEAHAKEIKLEENLKQLQQAQDDLASQRNKIAEYEAELNTAKYTISQLEEGVNFQRDLLEARNVELDNSVPKEKFAENMNELQEHKNTVVGLQEELDQNKQLIAILQEEQRKFADTQVELKDYQQLHSHAVNLYDELHTEHYQTNQQLAKLQSQYEESKEDHLIDLEQMDAEIKRLTEQLNNERNDSLNVQNQLSAIENDYERHISNHNELQNAYDQNLADLQQTQRAHDAIKDQLNETQSKLQQAHHDLEQQQIQHDQEKHDLQQQNIQHEQEKHDLRQQLQTATDNGQG